MDAVELLESYSYISHYVPVIGLTDDILATWHLQECGATALYRKAVLCSEDSRIIIEIFIILWHLLYHYKGANHVKGI